MSDPDSPVVLYRARHLIEAQALLSALEDAGLTARLEGEYLGTALGDVPLGINTAPRITVKGDQLPAAQAILDEFLSLTTTPASDLQNDVDAGE